MSSRGVRALSSIERLPAEADPALAWALAMYEQNRMTLTAISAELNRRLETIGIGPVSRSALHRCFTGAGREGLRRRLLDPQPASPEPLTPEMVEAIVDMRIEAALRRFARRPVRDVARGKQ